ncbi:MAG: hypothetical protein ACR2HF_08065 [Methylococcaceae bacterium]
MGDTSMDAPLSIAILGLSVMVMFMPLRHMVWPLAVCAACIPASPGVEMDVFTFTGLRLVLLMAGIRFLLRGEFRLITLNTLDVWVLLWVAWSLISSFLHADMAASLVNRLGLAYNVIGIYFYWRITIRSEADAWRGCGVLALVLIPLSVEMILEQTNGTNLFHIFGGVPELAESRGDRIRAQGPFSHPILAGTAGAVVLPLMMGYWNYHKGLAMLGILSCLIMVITSASSGPILATLAGLTGLCLRNNPVRIRWMLVCLGSGYIGAEMLMQAPAYYLISYIDLAGGSTGWHRAALIEAAFNHADEWWLAGSDYTRHWLAYGVSWSTQHVDITNYLVRMGVDGGVLQIVLFLLVLRTGFNLPPGQGVAFRASLTAHTISFLSISYFDQSIVFLYLTLALAATVKTIILPQPEVSCPVYTRY